MRRRLSFANVTSSIALFVALGGTSYAAIALPANSVGASQIRTHAVQKGKVGKSAVGRWQISANGVDRSELRTGAVGASEVRGNAVSSDEIADGTLQAADLSTTARSAISGVTFRAASTANGTAAGGNAKAIAHTAASGVYTVEFGQDVSACQYSATIGGVKSGTTIEPPAAGAWAATVTPTSEATKLAVTTVKDDGTVLDTAFHLLVAC